MAHILQKIGLSYGKAGPTAEEIQSLTDQFYVTLDAQISRCILEFKGSPPQVLLDLKNEVDSGPSGRNWNSAYRIEQKLLPFYLDDMVETELARRIIDARENLRPELSRWYDLQYSELEHDPSPAKSRELLARIVNDLQWRYTLNEVRRGYSKLIRGRTELLFGIAIAIAVLTGIIIDVWAIRPLTSEWHAALAAAAGIWGATFSMLISLKKRVAASSLDELKPMRSWGMLLARVLVGMGAAVILFFFLKAKLLEGQLFPDLASATSGADGGGGSQTGEVTQVMSGTGSRANGSVLEIQDYKLIVWCFLAGFSEKLVPNILAKSESRVGETATPMSPADVARPSPSAAKAETRSDQAGASKPVEAAKDSSDTG
jgi:hypothetical protein